MDQGQAARQHRLHLRPPRRGPVPQRRDRRPCQQAQEVETAAKRGKFVCGCHASQAKLAPNAALTGAEWNGLTAYKTIIDAAQSGKPHPNFVCGGLKDGFVKSSPPGAMVSEGARKNAEAVRAKRMAGSFDIFAGEIKGNTGKVVVPKGKAFKQTELELEGMNDLVEGVVGKV